MKVTRRDALKASGLALGGLAIGRAGNALAQCSSPGTCYPTNDSTQEYWYFKPIGASIKNTARRVFFVYRSMLSLSWIYI